ncbi:TonB-dependent receptor plug domain-containing protein [Asticcacaulis biprosthecium]|uniref:TonB-dependent receptor plug domain-containing protein n=1 Tax=Asticcacaulis biprosthecium TaxID=76891 RepID=UPI00058B6C9A|nr:TonB-dependent receptor [Asticcacaulis biprosthecium]
MKWVWVLCSAGALTAVTAPAFAEDVVIVSTRLKTAVPWSEHRAAKDGQSVNDVLEGVPGLTVLDGGVAGSRAELFVRGADANFTPVLIEGVPVHDLGDSRGGAFDFSTLAGDEISGVTVGQGPLSALYGSGALAGVVTTEIDLQPQLRLSVSGDEEYAVRLAGDVGLGDWTLNGAVRHGEDGDKNLGQWRTLSTVTAKLTGATPRDGRLSLFVRAANSDREGFDVASGGILYSNGEQQHIQDKDRLAGLSFRQPAGDGRSVNVNLAAFRRDQDQYSPAIGDPLGGGTPATVQTSSFDRIQATATYRAAGQRVDYAAGVGLMREQGEVDGVLDFGFFALPSSFEQDRSSAGVFGEGLVRLGGGFSLRGGARVDARDNDKAAWSHRASLEWQSADDRLALAGTWGRSLKVPSFYALGDPLVGSPDLQPEESEGGDVRVAYRFGDARLTVAAHSTVYRNLIDFDFATFKLVNRDKVEISGVDLGLDGPIGQRVTYEARVSTLTNDVNGSEDGLLHRPDLTAAFDVIWTPSPEWTVRLDNRYVGKRASNSIPTGDVRLKGYVRSDLTVGYGFGDGLALSARIGNLWDSEYETVAGFRARGRNVTVSLRKRW